MNKPSPTPPLRFPHSFTARITGLLQVKHRAYTAGLTRTACLALAAVLLLTACTALAGPQLPTPLPEAYIPTVVELTLQAGRLAWTDTPLPDPPTREPSATATRLPTATRTPIPPVAASVTPQTASVTPFTLPPTASSTPTPQVPNAEIEIRNLGAYSRIVSPLHIYAYLKPGAGGKVRIELLGEDNRLLARQIRTLNFVPVGAWAVMSMDLEFEIAATAEEARLQISVDDEYKRIVALNSVPLILLSVGDADIIPPPDVLAPLVIQQPTKRTLIQGGKLQVTGLARTAGPNPLLVRLITTQGQELGMRLASVSPPVVGDYGQFSVEVPYQIENPTQVLLVVSEGDEAINDLIHLSSLEVMLSP